MLATMQFWTWRSSEVPWAIVALAFFISAIWVFYGAYKDRYKSEWGLAVFFACVAMILAVLFTSVVAIMNTNRINTMSATTMLEELGYVVYDIDVQLQEVVVIDQDGKFFEYKLVPYQDKWVLVSPGDIPAEK